jgi:hypothetical protein
MRTATILGSLALALAASQPVHGAIIYGSLGNFDCINDTGFTAHGFEIELDGISPADVVATFGNPYNRYGDPTISTDGVNTFVRYASAYDTGTGTWAVGTDSGTYVPTDGHSLFFPQYGGSPAYPNVPGDHFGVATTVVPTNTIYTWLLDGGNGTLVKAGSQVRLPAPVFAVVPPANPVNPAGVQAVVQAPPPENGQEFGDAIWVKIFTTVIENPDPVELNDLVLGNAVVPPDSETEVEWQLLQTNPNRPDLAEEADESDLAAGNEAVVRRYEFYAYTGGYDPETHEALSDTYDPDLVGAYLGNQNVAANLLLGPAAVPEPSSLVLSGIAIVGFLFGAARRRRQRDAAR